ncbi:hypothetical protein Pmani_038709, partial [Petrolisthes manimaculis]
MATAHQESEREVLAGMYVFVGWRPGVR